MPFPHSDSPGHFAGVISLNSERSIKLIIKKLYTNWVRALTIDPNLVESLPKDSHNGYPTVFTPLFVTLRVAGHCFCQIGMLKKDSPNKLNTYWQFPKSFFVGFLLSWSSNILFLGLTLLLGIEGRISIAFSNGSIPEILGFPNYWSLIFSDLGKSYIFVFKNALYSLIVC